MIRRTRSLPQPRVIEKYAPNAMDVLREHHAQSARAKTQRRWPFSLELIQEFDVAPQLLAMFDDKCAYCETPVKELIVDWHRPPEEAMQLDGTVARDHYWWLVYDWENLYPICANCRSHKGQRFPVLRRRAEPEARGPELDDEGPLLLDPCRDEPERLLQYIGHGAVIGIDRRAETTIDVLALNRADLLIARNEAALEIIASLENPDISVDALRVLVASRRPYAGIRRWTARRILIERGMNDAYFAAVGLDDPAALALVRRTIHASVPVTESQSPSEATASLANVRLERVEIRNFKVIRRLTVQFRELTPQSGEPWLLLLGENGVGKSSLLKAVALALLDDDERQRWVPDASEMVRYGARRGQVCLIFSDGAEVKLEFSKDSPRFHSSNLAPPIVVLGYGPTRLPPPPELTPPPPSRVDVDNLFDPRAPLSDAERWLADVASVQTPQFNLHATDLKSLLPMTNEDRLLRRNGNLYATSFGVTVPLRELSDGYRSVIALATDLMLHLSMYWDSMQTAEGLLLLDEVEVHLHPRWRMLIVSLLRAVFPKLRVIATTHDPLCLQQTEPGEVFVLKRVDKIGIEAVRRDVPKGLRADQLLTGSWFGLSTTTDQDTANLLIEHGQLLLQPQTKNRQQRRRELENTLRDRLGHFAETSIERLAQEVTAQVMRDDANELGEASPEERTRLAASVLEAVRGRRGRQR